MSDPKYIRHDFRSQLGKVIEEAGEVQHVIGKILRWGLFSCNPELPIGERETNLLLLRTELKDLREAIVAIEAHIEADDENDFHTLDEELWKAPNE